MEEATKPCKTCCSAIPPQAVRCSHCKAWQSFGAKWRHEPLLLITTGIALVFPLILLPGLIFRPPLSTKGEDFAQYRDRIEVLQTSMVQHQEERAIFNEMVTLGRLRNNSPVTWTDVTIEVQYFDANDQLIGTATERLNSLVLLPDTEHAFQVSARLNQPAALYAKQKVFIRNAKDANAWP